MSFDPIGSRRGLRYLPDPLGRLGFGRHVPERDLPDPFGRLPAPAKPDPEIADFRNPLAIGDSVGMTGRNNRRDVAKIESLLGHLGDLNLSETDGVTGYAGLRFDDAIRRFQKRHGLKVDGRINPGGETITTLGTELAADKKPHPPGNSETEKPAPKEKPENPDSQRPHDPNQEEPSWIERIFGPASRILDDFRKPEPFPRKGPGVGGTRW